MKRLQLGLSEVSRENKNTNTSTPTSPSRRATVCFKGSGRGGVKRHSVVGSGWLVLRMELKPV